MLSKLIRFLTVDIWNIRLRNFPSQKAWLIKILRIIVLSFRGYKEDKCQFRASALTFYTLLSIVPVFAMMFGIAKGFGLDEMVTERIMANVQGQEQLQDVAKKIITFSTTLLEKTKGGIVAGIGIAILFITVIRVLGNIEGAFNYIWGVQKPRSIQRKFTDYLSVILVCPLLLVLSSSATVYLSVKIETITQQLNFISSLRPLILFSLKFLPYISLWVVFSFIFCFVPNTKVKLSSAVLAGIIAGTIFQLAQILYIKSQIFVTKYNEIYGSFAALPLFLIWLQLSWFIVLFGAEVSFAHQNVETFEREPDCLNTSISFRKKIAVLVVNLIAVNFQKAQSALSASQIGHQLDLPIRLLREILSELVEAKILAEVVMDKNTDCGYHPARPISDLTVLDITSEIEDNGLAEIDIADTDKFNRIRDLFNQIKDTARNCPANILVKDI